MVKSKKSPPTTLDPAALKAHTAKWKKLDATSESLGPHRAIDRPKAEAELSRALKFVKKPAAEILCRNEWTKAFSVHVAAFGETVANSSSI